VKIFIFEFVTGGGMADQPLPPGLTHEADLMLRSVLGDLGELPGIRCLTSRDPRLPPIPEVEALVASPGEDPFALYQRGLALADAAWPTAPETDGVLEHLGRLTLMRNRILLGTHPDAVRLTASKRATTSHLTGAGIPAAPTFVVSDPPLDLPGRWVVKPDDGAGAEETLVVADAPAARTLLREKGPGYVAQPWIEGEASSLSLLTAGGKARLLAVNRQRVRVAGGRVRLSGISVNAGAARAPRLAGLASEIAAAIPLLWGHVGVDLVLAESGPVVLEINPRLTTSYCGLGRALSDNPASWVLDLLRTGRLPDTPSPGSGKTVELDLETADVH
jgi:tyramine---L-glutamate ligase